MDWTRIDTVLLDLDGTLLDLAFDTFFWRERVPAVYAAARSMTTEAAHAALAPRFRAVEGTLEWYCSDYWSRELDLDIPAMHRADGARIVWIPGAEALLQRLRAAGKRLILLTNAHPKLLRVKDERTGVTRYFDAVFSSHTFGAPKENARFWQGLYELQLFDRERALFVDDNHSVLQAARAAGVRWIRAVCRPDSSGPRREHSDFECVETVAEL